jgi:hypothetical protein
MTTMGLLLGGALSCVALTTAMGCGGGGSSPRKPDTDAGAGATPPMAINCVDFCKRISDCAGELCDEDSMSMRYVALGEVLSTECDTTCSDPLLQSKVTMAQWQCLFTSSCREAVDSSYDVCHTMPSYTCS